MSLSSSDEVASSLIKESVDDEIETGGCSDAEESSSELEGEEDEEVEYTVRRDFLERMYPCSFCVKVIVSGTDEPFPFPAARWSSPA